jgi:hypothetical protein
MRSVITAYRARALLAIAAFALVSSVSASTITPQIGGGIGQFDGGISFSGPQVNFQVSNSGSDSNPCTVKLPCATVTHTLSVVGSTPNQTIGLAKGSVFRESGLTVGANGTNFVATGSGAMPQILGSTENTGPWTLVSGTEFSTPLNYVPLTAFWVSGSALSTTGVTKLRPGTAGSLSVGQFAASGTQLNINIGQNPTGQDIEVASNNVNEGIVVNNLSNVDISGIAVMFMSSACYDYGASSGTIQNYIASWCKDDGIDLEDGAFVTIQNGTVQGNGFQQRNAGGGPGDGISAHTGSTVHILGNMLLDNDQTAIGNENNTTCIAAFNFIRNSNNNLFIYNSNISTVGSHDWHYNIVVVTAADQQGIAINGPADSTSLSTVVNVSNNTVFSENGTTSPFTLVGIGAGTNTFENNIFSGGTFGIGDFNGSGGQVSHTNVNFNLYAATNANYQPGQLPSGTIGANEISAATAGFVSTTPGSENFNLTSGSAAIGAGTPLGFTRDFAGNPVANPPSIGALEFVH